VASMFHGLSTETPDSLIFFSFYPPSEGSMDVSRPGVSEPLFSVSVLFLRDFVGLVFFGGL